MPHIPDPRTERRDDDEQMFADLMKFVVQCLPAALSVIITDSQYDRTTFLTRVLERNQGIITVLFVMIGIDIKALSSFTLE